MMHSSAMTSPPRRVLVPKTFTKIREKHSRVSREGQNSVFGKCASATPSSVWCLLFNFCVSCMMSFFLFHIKVHKLAGGVLIRKKKKKLLHHTHIDTLLWAIRSWTAPRASVWRETRLTDVWPVIWCRPRLVRGEKYTLPPLSQNTAAKAAKARLVTIIYCYKITLN